MTLQIFLFIMQNSSPPLLSPTAFDNAEMETANERAASDPEAASLSGTEC